MKTPLFFPLAAVLLALCAGLASGQRPVLEIDVVATDAGDGFVGLSEVSTDNLATNTIARVKGQTTPGDGGGGTYLWNGSAWSKYLKDDYATAAGLAAEIARATAAEAANATAATLNRNHEAGLYLDFDRADLYPDATEFSNGSVNWSDGSTPLRVNIDPPDGGVAADYQPYIENGGVRPADSSVVYLGGNVAKEGDVFSMGVDFTLNEGFPDSVNTISWNVSFANRVIQDAGGIYPVGIAHFNLSHLGVNQGQIFGSPLLVAANRPLIGSAYRWDDEAATVLQSGKRYTLLVRAWDDVVELTIKGVGTVVYQDAAFSAIHGPDMHFWVEPFPATSRTGTQSTHYCTIHRVWAMDEARDSLPAKANRVTEVKPDLFGVNGFPASVGVPDDAPITISARESEAFPSSAKEFFKGGHIYLRGGKYVADVGINNVAGSVTAVAQMSLRSNITDRLSSSACAETTLKQAEMQNWLEPSESEDHTFYGTLVGTNAKQIRVSMTVYTSNVIFDSNASGTPLDALEGPYVLHVKRFHHSAQAFRFYTTLTLPDGSTIIQHFSSNSGAGRGVNDLTFKTTTTDAGGITLDGMDHDTRRLITK